jgi:predicted ArsR family transcriptional regulator
MSSIRQTLLETLNRRGPLSIEELALAAHLSTMATRYHLRLLERQGLIVLRDSVHCGAVGRPQRIYALAEGAYAHLPNQYDQLAGNLIDEIEDTLGPKEARALLRRAGRRAAEEAPGTRRRTRLESRLHQTSRFLSARGYVATCVKTDEGPSLVVCNCPYRHVAQTHRQVCDLDRAMIGALLDAPVKMTHCIANQDPQCRFVLGKRNSEQHS